MTPYMHSLETNLRHLETLRPPMPKRNLAGSNSDSIAPTEEDTYLAPQIHWQTIQPGRKGTELTVKTIAAAARQDASNPNIQQFARQFQSLDGLEKWVRDHFVYRDETEEIFRTPAFMLADMGRMEANRVVGLEGDCDDISGFIAAITKALGYPTRLTAIRYDPANPDFEHVYTEALSHGTWRILDPTIEEGVKIRSIETMREIV